MDISIVLISLVIYHIALKQYQEYIYACMIKKNAKTIAFVFTNTDENKFINSFVSAQSMILDNMKVINIWNITKKDKEKAEEYKKGLEKCSSKDLLIYKSEFDSLVYKYIRANFFYNILPVIMLFIIVAIYSIIKSILHTKSINYDFRNLSHDRLECEISLIYQPNTRKKVAEFAA